MGCTTKKLPISVILSRHRTNITLSQEKLQHPKSFITSLVAYIPFMPYDISFDYTLSTITQADIVKMDRFFLNTHDT